MCAQPFHTFSVKGVDFILWDHGGFDAFFPRQTWHVFPDSEKYPDGQLLRSVCTSCKCIIPYGEVEYDNFPGVRVYRSGPCMCNPQGYADRANGPEAYQILASLLGIDEHEAILVAWTPGDSRLNQG